MNLNDRFDRLDCFIEQGRLVRKAWGDGQERACLLLALAPEVGTDGVMSRCPASVLPPWLAELTPGLDDNGTEAAWPAMVRRYAAVVRRGAETLDDAGWRRVLARFMIAVLAEATPHDSSGSCQRVSALWSRVLHGDEPGEEEWQVAVKAARAGAAWAAAREAAAAEAATWAARAASRAARRTSSRAVRAAWDRITTALLDAIEIERGEHRREGEA